MRIVVIEPHPDDAFLSLGWTMEKVWPEFYSDLHLTLVTVYANPKRGKEAQAYAEAIGASSIVLGLAETNMGVEYVQAAIPALDQALEPLNADMLVFPLGLQHPDHLRVRDAAPPGAYYYLDTPYQTKQKLQYDLYQRAEGKQVWSIVYPPKRKWRHYTIFKSQSLFFHYNSPEKLSNIPEIIVW